MRSNFCRRVLILALLAGGAFVSMPAMADSKGWWGDLMYTYYCCPNKPRHAYPQYGPVFRGPGYAYWGPPTYNLGVPYHYRRQLKGGLFATR